MTMWKFRSPFILIVLNIYNVNSKLKVIDDKKPWSMLQVWSIDLKK